MTPPLVSRCPHCGAVGVKIADVIERDGYVMRFDYCGKCGKNYPMIGADEDVKHRQAGDR